MPNVMAALPNTGGALLDVMHEADSIYDSARQEYR